MDTTQAFIGMLYSHWMVIAIVVLFFFNFAMLAPSNAEFKTFRYICIGLGSAVVIIFTVMPVPQFVQSKMAVHGFVAQKSNEDSMFSLRLGAENICKDGVVMGFEFMTLNYKFGNDIDRIIEQKSSFSMDLKFKDQVPDVLINGKRPICAFTQLKG